MISTGSEPSTEDRWEGRPPMTGGPLFGQSAPFIFLYVIWKGGLYGPLQAQPLVKVGRLRSNLTVLLDTDISGYSLNTVLGPMGPDRPLQNFIWESSKLLTLVQNSQRPRSPNPGDVRSAKGRFQGEIFIRHPPGPGDRVTKVVKFSRGQTGRDILEQIHHIVGDDWYLLYGGKILDLDATLPYWFRDKTLDLMGTLKAGSPTDPDGVGEAGDTHMEGGGAGSGGPGVRGSPDGAAGDDEMAWDEEEATGEEQDGPSDLDRTRARDWCQELLNIGQLNTNAECIAMLSELFNLSEHKALTLISEHLYGSVTRSPSLVSQLRALAAKFEQEWQTFLEESGTPHPTTITMWAELCRELVEIMELTIGVTRALDNMNIPPGMRGTWGTACMFSPDTAARGESGTGAAKVTIQRTQGAVDKARALYLGQTSLHIPGHAAPTLQICRDNLSNHALKIALDPVNEAGKRQFTFIVALISLFRNEGGILCAGSFLLRRDAGWVSLAELYTSGTGRNLAGLMNKTGFQRTGQLVAGISCHQPGMAVHTQRILDKHEGTIIELEFLNSAPKDHQIPDSSHRFRNSLNCSFQVSRLASITTRAAASVAAVSLRINHNSISNNLFSGVAEGSQRNVTAVELLLEARFPSLIRYCAAQQLSEEHLGILLQSLRVEVTAPRNEITERSNIILLFNDQGHFSLAQLRFFALQVAVLCAIRSDRPEHRDLAWCPVVAFDPMSPPGPGTNKSHYCSVASVSARGEGGVTESIFMDPSRIFSFDGTTDGSTLRWSDRVPKPSGKAVAVLASGTTDSRSGMTLVHPRGAEYVTKNGTTGKTTATDLCAHSYGSCKPSSAPASRASSQQRWLKSVPPWQI